MQNNKKLARLSRLLTWMNRGQFLVLILLMLNWVVWGFPQPLQFIKLDILNFVTVPLIIFPVIISIIRETTSNHTYRATVELLSEFLIALAVYYVLSYTSHLSWYPIPGIVGTVLGGLMTATTIGILWVLS